MFKKKNQSQDKNHKKKKGFPKILKILGPGLITGAADDDPSGIAAYSQAGAQFGYGLLWMMPFLYPLMVAVQEACARIGAVTKKGIAQVIRENYSKKILFSAVFLIVIANIINIGADLGAMAAALELITPIPFIIAVVAFALLILLLEIFVPYKTYSKILKWCAIALFAYPIALIVSNVSWDNLLKSTFSPNINFDFTFLFILTGIIGTTISPYMFFWQASEEVEEEIEDHIDVKKNKFKKFLLKLRIDNALGMLISQIVAWCIIALTGTVLFSEGIFNINTATDAAEALEPLVATFPGAGFLTKIIFAFGIIGLGLLAVPVLAGSAAYAVAEAFSWKEGLYRKIKKARGFYGVIIIATLIGLFMNFMGIDPIRALIVTAIINAIVSIPLLFLIYKISSNKKIMGEYSNKLLSKIFLLIAFAVVLSAAGLMIFSFIK